MSSFKELAYPAPISVIWAMLVWISGKTDGRCIDLVGHCCNDSGPVASSGPSKKRRLSQAELIAVDCGPSNVRSRGSRYYTTRVISLLITRKFRICQVATAPRKFYLNGHLIKEFETQNAILLHDKALLTEQNMFLTNQVSFFRDSPAHNKHIAHQEQKIKDPYSQILTLGLHLSEAKSDAQKNLNLTPQAHVSESRLQELRLQLLFERHETGFKCHLCSESYLCHFSAQTKNPLSCS
ncbi:hypothetical protein C8J56DRAFT_899813 [Mycena floridula]|nr:hypothetical protein C8J56DRAFT_899813 [Mycena floridula]